MFGQIIQPGREFHPPCTGLTARAVYNESEIAFELSWNDMRAETTGKNGPDIAVPASEDAPSQAAPPAAAGASPWGDAEEAAPAATSESAEGFWGEDGGATAPAASEFSDAVAIQFPVEIPTTIRKPYFIFGDKGNPVDLWFFDLAKKQPDLYVGHGSDSIESHGPRGLDAVSRYDKGRWTVAIKRKLRSQGEVPFDEGGFVPVAFSVWDGFSRERGNKRALTNWWTLYLSPGEQPSPRGRMAKWAGLTLALELAFIGWARRRSRRRDMQAK
jgi:hypothetical protein